MIFSLLSRLKPDTLRTRTGKELYSNYPTTGGSINLSQNSNSDISHHLCGFHLNVLPYFSCSSTVRTNAIVLMLITSSLHLITDQWRWENWEDWTQAANFNLKRLVFIKNKCFLSRTEEQWCANIFCLPGGKAWTFPFLIIFFPHVFSSSSYSRLKWHPWHF